MYLQDSNSLTPHVKFFGGLLVLYLAFFGISKVDHGVMELKLPTAFVLQERCYFVWVDEVDVVYIA